jgi:hypothetical protein
MRSSQSVFLPICKIKESDAGLHHTICQPGAKTLDTIHKEIKRQDKLLLILSENSIASDWVEDEVTMARAEEHRRGKDQLVLFPVRIDDAVKTTSEPWACMLRDQRNVGDFRQWKDHDAYQNALERLLRDLTVDAAKP